MLNPSAVAQIDAEIVRLTEWIKNCPSAKVVTKARLQVEALQTERLAVISAENAAVTERTETPAKPDNVRKGIGALGGRELVEAVRILEYLQNNGYGLMDRDSAEFYLDMHSGAVTLSDGNGYYVSAYKSNCNPIAGGFTFYDYLTDETRSATNAQSTHKTQNAGRTRSAVHQP